MRMFLAVAVIEDACRQAARLHVMNVGERELGIERKMIQINKSSVVSLLRMPDLRHYFSFRVTIQFLNNILLPML